MVTRVQKWTCHYLNGSSTTYYWTLDLSLISQLETKTLTNFGIEKIHFGKPNRYTVSWVHYADRSKTAIKSSTHCLRTNFENDPKNADSNFFGFRSILVIFAGFYRMVFFTCPMCTPVSTISILKLNNISVAYLKCWNWIR